MTSATTKKLGAMKHLLLELQKVGSIADDNMREHLLNRYIRHEIHNFRHLAEYLLAIRAIGAHNYDQIILYSNRYGEN
jgi:hypothetical protein